MNLKNISGDLPAIISKNFHIENNGQNNKKIDIKFKINSNNIASITNTDNC